MIKKNMCGGVHQAFAGECLGDPLLFNCSNVLLIQVSADDHDRNPKDRGHLELVGRLTCVVHNVHVYVDDKTSGCCLLRFQLNSNDTGLSQVWFRHMQVSIDVLIATHITSFVCHYLFDSFVLILVQAHAGEYKGCCPDSNPWSL